jgi:NADH:ubiquinone oxidoreductase subunit 6 (subunit J)
MKCWNSAFNAQGLRLIIIVVHVGAVKIYVVVVEALRKKERQDETQFTTKIGGKTSLGPSYFTL